MDSICFQVRSIKVESTAYITQYTKKILKLQYEFADARTNSFTWYEYSSWFTRFCPFKIWYCKILCMYCFLPFDFKNGIIFVINPSGFYLTSVGADLDYPNLLCYSRSSWSKLRFQPSLKLWWRRAQDFNGSQILVTPRGFHGFSRLPNLKFQNFELLRTVRKLL